MRAPGTSELVLRLRDKSDYFCNEESCIMSRQAQQLESRLFPEPGSGGDRRNFGHFFAKIPLRYHDPGPKSVNAAHDDNMHEAHNIPNSGSRMHRTQSVKLFEILPRLRQNTTN